MKRLLSVIAAMAAFIALSATTALAATDNEYRHETVLSEGWTVVRDSVRTEFVNALDIPYSEMGKHIDLCLDGIKGPYTLSINSEVIGEETDGRVPAVYDITSYVNFGVTNKFVIEAKAITGDVRIISSNPVHIAANGTSVRTNWGKVTIATTLSNDDFRAIRNSSVAVSYSITGPYGEHVLDSEQKIIELAPSQTGTVTTDLTVSVPFMWDFDARYTYQLHTTVYCGGKVVDRQITPFAFRDIEFHTTRGFLLNNRKVMLVGVNLSNDPVEISEPVPAELWRYRLQRIKDLGFNAVRCTDSPASPAMLDICDEIGLLVIDETPYDGTSRSGLEDFRTLVARDGNHPSLMLWGIKAPNTLKTESRGCDMLQIAAQRARLVDPQHKTFCFNAVGNALAGGADVSGAAGHDLKAIDALHVSHPEHFVLGSNAAPSLECWNYFEGKKYLGGLFINEGLLFDSNYTPKEGACFIQTRTSAKPMVQVCRISDDRIRVYSNCEEVDLVIGNKSLARRRISQSGYVDFSLSDNWTSLTSRGYRRGSVAASAKYAKAGTAPVITASKDKMNADGRDVVVLDILCTEPLELNVTGPARIIGCGSDTPGTATVTPCDGRAQLILKSLSGKIGFVNVSVPGQKAPIVVSVI